MWSETILRFFLGGAVVSIFAIASNAFEPRTFAGIFSAAPSLALATLALTYCKYGTLQALLEGRSMIGGAIAMLLYSLSSARLVAGGVAPAVATIVLWMQWLGTAFLAWALLSHR